VTSFGPFYFEEGPYFLLIEMDCKSVNEVNESQWKLTNNSSSGLMMGDPGKRLGENLNYWRDIVIGVEGINGDWCRIDSLATEERR
jgi:hypothetical protein